jgi:hypothetical protein
LLLPLVEERELVEVDGLVAGAAAAGWVASGRPRALGRGGLREAAVRLPEIRQEVTDAQIGLLWVVGENVMRRLRDSFESGKAVGNRLGDLVC